MPEAAEVIESEGGSPAAVTTSLSQANPGATGNPGVGNANPAASGAQSQHATEQMLARIAKLTARNKELEARSNAGTATPVERALNEQNLEELAEAKAQIMAKEIAAKTLSQQSYDRACEGLVEQGKKDFGESEFNAKVAEIRKLWDPNDKQNASQFTGLIQAAIDSEMGPKLVYLLGDDLAEAKRIMGLSPGKQAAALMKLSLKDPPQELSEAPKPITPIGSRGRAHEAIEARDPTRSDRLTTKEWMARRNLEAAEVNKKAGRRVL